jgi:DNA-binding transcriptional LysR family regulator
MQLRHIEVFRAVMETGSMTAAGQLIHLSQSAVSRAIASAETRLGFALFHRLRGRLVPTFEARILFEECGTLHEQLEAVREAANKLKKEPQGPKPQGPLRIGATWAIYQKLMPELAMAFHRQLPGQRCELRLLPRAQLAAGLRTHSIDLALDFFALDEPSLRGQTLAEGKLHALLPRSRTRFFAGRQATPTQLQQWHRSAPMIGLFDNNPVWLAFSRHCENHGLNPQPAIRVETSGLAEDIVALGEAWTVADPLSAARAHADVFAVPLIPAVPCPLIAFRHEDAPPNALATRFTDIAAGLLGTLHVGAA